MMMNLEVLQVAAENKPVMCLRCGSEMSALDEAYVMPRSRSSNLDEVKADLTKVIMLQVFRCSNAECGAVELKAPHRFPSLSPARH